MSEPTSGAEAKRYALEQLLGHLDETETEQLKDYLRVHGLVPYFPPELPVAEDERPNASAILVHVLVGSAIEAREKNELLDVERAADAWKRLTDDYAEMVANDLRLMWAEGNVHQPAFYGFGKS